MAGGGILPDRCRVRRRAAGEGARLRVRGEGGSVLLEGILVLPIYLMLLGALFIIGDLMRARMKLQVVERCITWIGGDRYSGHGADGMKKLLAAVGDTETAPVTGLSVAELRDGDRLAGNSWLDAFMGFAVVEVDVPVWMRLANAHAARGMETTAGEKEELPFGDSYVVPAGENGEAVRQYRHLLVRRRPETGDPNYLRRAAGIEVADNVWINVSQREPWVEGGEDRGFHDMPAAQEAAQEKEDYQRKLVAYGE